MKVPHLCCHSDYSFLQGVDDISDLVSAAADQGAEYIGLTDIGGLYNALRFTAACRQFKIKPVYGVDLPWQEGRICLLARQIKGYQALCAIISRYQNESVPIAEAVMGHGDDVVAILDCGDTPALAEIFRYRFLRALPYVAPPRQSLPLVAAPPVWYVKQTSSHVCQLLQAVRLGQTLSEDYQSKAGQREFGGMLSSMDFQQQYALAPTALANATIISRECSFWLDFGAALMPVPPLPPGETPFAKLWQLAMQGVKKLYKQPDRNVMERLSAELSVIDRRQLAGYFLVMADIVRFCDSEGIIAVGRGSAAGSLVAYCLGITRVCPLGYDLYFERFLNESRQDLPDIDLDICGASRDLVLDYVYQTYSHGHAAMLASTICMQARQSFREAAKVFALPPEETEALIRQVPWRLAAADLAAWVQHGCQHGLPLRDSPYREIVGAVRHLLGRPRHLGIHPCGMVVSPEPLTQRVPLQKAPKGITVTQFDMERIEETGLVKLDLLGQRALTVANLTLAAAGITKSQRIEFFWQIPPDDPAVMERIAAGETLAVFQLESPSMRGMLERMRPANVADVALALAVIRPGAGDSGSRDQFIDYFKGKGKPATGSNLEKILAESYGAVVYQEQVMRIAREVGGLDLAQADMLRRLMTRQRGDTGELERLGQDFLRKAVERGITEDEAKRAWQMMARFAGYGFCKAHAVSYADVACRMAWLKLNFPARYMAAVCSAGSGFYGNEAYLGEAMRLGIELLPPDVCRAGLAYSALDNHRLLLPLTRIHNLGDSLAGKIIQQRHSRPFANITDFVLRVAPGRAQLEALAKAGALDAFGASRPAILAQGLAMLGSAGKMRDHGSLFVAEDNRDEHSLPDFSRFDKGMQEMGLLGTSLAQHPLSLFADTRKLCAAWRQAPIGSGVTCAGRLIAWRRIRTRAGGQMLFMTLDDPVGVFEVTVNEPCLSRDGQARYAANGMLRIEGRRDGFKQIQGERLRPLKKA
jgi:DNA-directed DNA polymerase III PolC